MSVTIRITVEDITDRLVTYDVIRVYRSDTLGGSYTVQDTITLVAGTYHYSWEDTTGTLNHWFKYSFYNTSTTDESSLSDPFRVEGTTRLRIRQTSLGKYGAGIILVNTGTDNNKVTTSDYRFKTSFYKSNRGRGQWLLPTTGENAGSPRIIYSSSPTDGTFTVLPAWGSSMGNGDQVEWHTLADPNVWADAINRGLGRYHYVDIIPIVPGTDNEYSLAALPWLTDREQIHDVRWFPTSTIEIDESYVGDGRWWGTRKDGDAVTLLIYPAVSATQVLYLEATRPMPALYTDAAALPNVADEELAAALAYDEVLAFLSSPGVGTAQERTSWLKARVLHSPELRRLLRNNRPKPRYGPVTPPYPPVVPSRFKAR